MPMFDRQLVWFGRVVHVWRGLGVGVSALLIVPPAMICLVFSLNEVLIDVRDHALFNEAGT